MRLGVIPYSAIVLRPASLKDSTSESLKRRESKDGLGFGFGKGVEAACDVLLGEEGFKLLAPESGFEFIYRSGLTAIIFEPAENPKLVTATTLPPLFTMCVRSSSSVPPCVTTSSTRI